MERDSFQALCVSLSYPSCITHLSNTCAAIPTPKKAKQKRSEKASIPTKLSHTTLNLSITSTTLSRLRSKAKRSRESRTLSRT